MESGEGSRSDLGSGRCGGIVIGQDHARMEYRQCQSLKSGVTEVWRNGREDTMSKRTTIRINRNAGTIEATGADGVSDGIIYIVPDGNGWGRTALNGARVAAYDPDRNRLIDNVIAMLSERTPCDVIEVGERPTQYA